VSPAQLREAVDKLQASTVSGEEEAWGVLRPLGIAVVPFLLEAYPRFRRWQGRASLVYHAVPYARQSEDAVRLGIQASRDKSWVVRYRALGVLAYSLRRDTLGEIRPQLSHPDKRTVADAAAAIAAIEEQNHHLFHDRDRSGRTRWIVNENDRDA
jgi:hypothetical protein